VFRDNLAYLQDQVDRLLQLGLRVAPPWVWSRQRFTAEQVCLCHIAQCARQIGSRFVKRIPERQGAREIKHLAKAHSFFPPVRRLVDQHDDAFLFEFSTTKLIVAAVIPMATVERETGKRLGSKTSAPSCTALPGGLRNSELQSAATWERIWDVDAWSGVTLTFKAGSSILAARQQ
jgi:hypothetical protein